MSICSLTWRETDDILQNVLIYGRSKTSRRDRVKKPGGSLDQTEQAKVQGTMAAPLFPGMIKSPGPNDILLGRGSGPNQFEGNKQFRRLVEERKDEYMASNKHKEKKKIAAEVLEQIRSLGGQFLELRECEETEVGSSIVLEGTWIVAPYDVGLEKCKQALRQKKKTGINFEDIEARSESESSEKEKLIFPPAGLSNAPFGWETASLGGVDAISHPYLSGAILRGHTLPMVTMAPKLSSMMIGGGGLTILQADTRSMLYEAVQTGFQPGVTMPRPLATNPGNASWQGALSTAGSLLIQDLHQRKLARINMPRQVSDLRMTLPTNPAVNGGATTASCSSESKERLLSAEMPNKEEAAFALSSLMLVGEPRFTEEDIASEQATLTNEERAAALSDMFGKFCMVGIRPEKRARRDLDDDSIQFLTRQMKLEIEKIPSGKKQALLEAQAKCRAEEFGAGRLESFLRCEGMNTEVCTAWIL